MLIKGKTILIADYDLNNYRLLEEILIVIGCNVLHSDHSDNACNQILSSQIDMVLVDMVTPEMNGAKTINKIRNLNKDIKIVGQIESGSDSRVVMKVGGDDCINRPCNGKDLTELMMKYFK